jgi:XTP/dITP diphosphohydrolase
MTTDRPLLLASHNQGKLRELGELLRDIPVMITSLGAFPNLQAVRETGATFRENSSLKATGYARQTRMLTIADDSGLEVKALGNRPGVFSARYAGPGASDEQRTQKLLSELASLGTEERSARFCCSVALADEEGQIIHVSDGVCEGRIAIGPRGSAGFGYDPIFIPEGFQQTFAELEPEIKNQISHRARALASAREFLRSLTSSSNAG